MDFQNGHTDERILEALGHRIERTRLRRGWTQADLAREAGVSKRTVERLEDGASVAATSLIRTLRALDRIEGLSALLPDPRQSPIEEVDEQAGKSSRGQRRARPRERQRASGSKVSEAEAADWTWGDES